MLNIKYALAVGAGIVALAGAANAAELRSVVTSVDPNSHVIVLSDGSYELAPGVDASTIQVGRPVIVTYSLVDGRRIISRMQPMISEQPSPGEEKGAGPAGDQPQPQ